MARGARARSRMGPRSHPAAPVLARRAPSCPRPPRGPPPPPASTVAGAARALRCPGGSAARGAAHRAGRGSPRGPECPRSPRQFPRARPSLSHAPRARRRPACSPLARGASAEGGADGGCAWPATWRGAPSGPRIDPCCPAARLSPVLGLRVARVARTGGARHARWSGVAGAGGARATVGEPPPVAQLPDGDPVLRRSESMRPVCLDECPAPERAAPTPRHPDPIGTLTRRVERQGMRGLCPAHVAVSPRGRRRQRPEAAVPALQRRTGLSGGLHERALGRMSSEKTGDRLAHTPIKRLGPPPPCPSPPPLPRLDDHRHPPRPQARAQGMTLSGPGWTTIRMRRFRYGLRPTVREGRRRCEPEDRPGWADKRRAPQAPARQAWLPRMLAVSPLPKRHPDAGRFRLWRV